MEHTLERNSIQKENCLYRPSQGYKEYFTLQPRDSDFFLMQLITNHLLMTTFMFPYNKQGYAKQVALCIHYFQQLIFPIITDYDRVS